MSMPLPPVLFVSNGYGEDTIAASIVREVLASGLKVMALPLVGAGGAYERLGVEIVGPRELMPSGGLIMEGPLNFLRDLKAGLWRVTSGQMGTLRRLRHDLGAVVAVGDTYPVLLGSWCTRQKIVMVGTAKSNWFYAYSSLEELVFRRSCEVVFARDEPTAARLREHGVNALWVGNAMMDCLEQSEDSLPLAADRPCVALLPGSRNVAYRDLPTILDGLLRLHRQRPVQAAMALPGSIELEELAGAAAEHGWSCRTPDPPVRGVRGILHQEGVDVLLAWGRFGDVVDAAVLVIGQAGTGNEQAVGMGKPTIAFDSDGRCPPGWYRARQKGLLGDSLAVVERSGEAIAREALAIMDDEARYRSMQEAGFARMGPPGGSRRMADAIVDLVCRRAGRATASPPKASVSGRS